MLLGDIYIIYDKFLVNWLQNVVFTKRTRSECSFGVSMSIFECFGSPERILSTFLFQNDQKVVERLGDFEQEGSTMSIGGFLRS